MSCDLGVFYFSKPVSDAEATRRYVACCEESDLSALIEPHESVAAFLSDLTQELPQINDWPEDELDQCPWSCAFDVSEGHVLMPMVWSAADAASARIVALSRKHRVVCVDPQSERILTAPWLTRTQVPWWQFWKRVPG